MCEKKLLSGIKVVELSTYVAVPAAGRILAEWGAEVIKIEAKGGELWRHYPEIGFQVPSNEEENPLFDLYNAYKKSLVLDLKTEAGRQVMDDLLDSADIFITNNRVKSLKQNGLDWESLHAKYPKLIYGLLTGFGEKGPDASKPGFDMVAYWVSSGFMMDLRIDADNNYPIYPPFGVGDVTTGSMLLTGILAALYNRTKTGLGDKISTSLYGCAIWTMATMNCPAQEKYNYKYPKKRTEGTPLSLPFRARDGEWISLSVLDYERYYATVFHLLGLDDLIDDPRFTTRKAYVQPENKAYLIERMEAAFLQKDADEWCALLTQADIVNDKLMHFRDISKSEQAIVNHNVEEFTFANGEKAMMARPPVQSEYLGFPELKAAPLLGADTLDILKKIGYSQEKIEKLLQEGIVCAHE